MRNILLNRAAPWFMAAGFAFLSMASANGEELNFALVGKPESRSTSGLSFQMVGTPVSVPEPMAPATPEPSPPDVPEVTKPTVFAYKDFAIVCPGCQRLDRMKHLLPFSIEWKQAPRWVRSYPTLHWKGVDGEWYQYRWGTGGDDVEQASRRYAATMKPQRDTAAQAPTPHSKIAEGLEDAGLKPGQTFVDIGCGDGRALLVAVELFHASKAIGIELDSQQAAEARRRVSLAGLSDKIEIIEGDATELDLPDADVAYVYLYPDTLESLKPQLEKFSTVVSYLHRVPGLPMRNQGDFYIWKRGSLQVRQPQPYRRQRPTAVWNGRAYSGPVCNSPNCRMCNTIRSQLQRASR